MSNVFPNSVMLPVAMKAATISLLLMLPRITTH